MYTHVKITGTKSGLVPLTTDNICKINPNIIFCDVWKQWHTAEDVKLWKCSLNNLPLWVAVCKLGKKSTSQDQRCFQSN